VGTVNEERTVVNLKRLATKRALVLGAVVVFVVAAAGAALATTNTVFDPKAERDAFEASVANKLGVTTKQLEDAYKAAALERLDAAVTDGRLTKEQADDIRQHIESGDFLGPFAFGFFGRPHLEMHGPGPFGQLDAAADYLGLTDAQLRDKLFAGQSLTEIAKAQGKSVDGLKNAMLAAAKERLDQAVKDGHLTAAQRDEMLKKVESALDDIVNRSGPPPLGHREFGQPFGLFHDDARFAPPSL
jgi:hypothetical protein